MSSNKSQCTDGDSSHSSDEDDFETGPVDHPDEEGGSKLCEIGGNEQWEGQLIFLNSI